MSIPDTGGMSPTYNTLLTSSPLIAEGDAAVLVARHYGLAATAATLPGERDSNFRIDTDRGPMVLKIIHGGESPQTTDGQTAVLQHMSAVAPHLPVPRLVADVQGNFVPVAAGGPAVGRRMRMITLLPGASLKSARSTPELRRAVGRTLGAVDAALASFEHPAATEPTLWDIGQLPKLRPLVEEIDDPAKRRRLLTLIDDFLAEVAGPLAALRTQPIHNDFSGDNLIVDATGEKLCGVLDFGDMTTSQLVNDVAVAATYQLSDDLDPTEAAADVVRGFEQVTPLTDNERELLFGLILARQATRLTMTEWRAARFPENRAYILRNTARSWRQLDALLSVSRNAFQERIHP